MDGICIAHEWAIEAGGSNVDHKSGLAAQSAEAADQQQPQAQEKPRHRPKIHGGGAEIEGQVVSGGEEQQGAAWLEQGDAGVKQGLRPSHMLNAVGAEDQINTGRRQHAFGQRGDQHLVGHLLEIGLIGGGHVLADDGDRNAVIGAELLP